MNVFDMLRAEIESYMETVYGCKIDEVVEYQTKNDGKEISYIVQGLVEAYGAISTVEKEYNNGWIQCAAGLPPVPEINPVFDNKPLELYLVTEAYVPYPCRAFWNGRCFTDGINIINAIAWQQLPPVYKLEEK